jgi:CheY-like chemotaxis protein
MPGHYFWVSVIGVAEQECLGRYYRCTTLHFLCTMSPKYSMLALVIEDEPATRFIWQIYLQNMNITVQTANDGVQGLALARSLERKPDIIISDYNMPLMSGAALWRALRAEERTRTTPFVLASSYIAVSGAVLAHDAELEAMRHDAYTWLIAKETVRRGRLEKLLVECGVWGSVV